MALVAGSRCLFCLRRVSSLRRRRCLLGGLFSSFRVVYGTIPASQAGIVVLFGAWPCLVAVPAAVLLSCPASAWFALLFDCERYFGGVADAGSGVGDSAEYVPGVFVACEQCLLDVFDDVSCSTGPVGLRSGGVFGPVGGFSCRDVVEPVAPFELFYDRPG